MTFSAQTKIAAAAALAVVLGTAVPGLAAADEASTPVGAWDGVVTVEGAPAQPATLYFTAAGKACVVFGSGSSASTGVGTWQATGADAFSFVVTRGAKDPAGNPVTVKASQQAAQTGESLTSTGTSDVFASDGTPLGSYPSKSSATRTSAEDPTASCV